MPVPRLADQQLQATGGEGPMLPGTRVLYRVSHRTTYTYSDLVSICHNEARITPRNHGFQQVSRAELFVDPHPTAMASRRDFYGNHVHNFTVQEPHRRFSVEAESVVELTEPQRPDPADGPTWEQVRERLITKATTEGLWSSEFVYDSTLVPTNKPLANYARESFTRGRPLIEAALELNHRIYTDFEYDPAATTIATPVEEVLLERRGVCQDFAHVMLGCLRSLGLAARYVSGYLLSLPDRVGAEASHAWVGLYHPDWGWIDFDPTNNMSPTTGHVTVAWGRDFDDVSPVKGVVLGGGHHKVEVAVQVTPAIDHPGAAAG